jgi:MFS family permease
MVGLDALVVTIALVTIRRDVHASVTQLDWTVNAYVLSFGVLILLGAVLGDRLGRRRIFSAGLAIFTTASAACALAPSRTVPIAARAVQGAGGGADLLAQPPRSRRPRVFEESRGPHRPIDAPGVLLASGGLLALVWAVMCGSASGWTSAKSSPLCSPWRPCWPRSSSAVTRREPGAADPGKADGL